MSGSIATRAIAGSALGGDDDWEPDEDHGGYRRKRVRVLRNRYPEEPAPEPAPEASTPTYDALPDDQKEAVDRLVVAVRMTHKQGLV